MRDVKKVLASQLRRRSMTGREKNTASNTGALLSKNVAARINRRLRDVSPKHAGHIRSHYN